MKKFISKTDANKSSYTFLIESKFQTCFSSWESLFLANFYSLESQPKINGICQDFGFQLSLASIGCHNLFWDKPFSSFL